MNDDTAPQYSDEVNEAFKSLRNALKNLDVAIKAAPDSYAFGALVRLTYARNHTDMAIQELLQL